MKTVTAHLLEYAVNVVCNGNRSECARKLGVMRPDFNKLYRRCMNGGNSVTAIEGIPQEDTLRFGVEFTNVIDAFAPARSGSLRREDKNHWVAEFEFEPMKKVLPCPGRHTFFLGGRLEGGSAFAGRIVAEVKA